MGEVYLGEKVGPEGFVKPVVLKCVLPQLASDRGFVQLFLDEARLAALLNHPNIAQVYDFGVVDGTYYIAMEYVPGYTFEDLRRKLRSLGAFMPLQHIAHVASQACQGLHYAHALTDARGESLGLVHRDVSPHNLIVSIDGTVKLVDFGIAKARSGLTRVRAKGAVGKHGYASPEQSRGEGVDGRSDVFSLGICLWELSTNERLWPPSLERPPEYRPDEPIRAIDSVRPEVPRHFSSILQRALAIDVRERFSNAQTMHVELERFQAAMSHYAGQAALAQFIADLVEGRVPPGATASSSSARSGDFDALTAGLALDEGVPAPSPSSAGGRRLPASWDEPASPPRPDRASDAAPSPDAADPRRAGWREAPSSGWRGGASSAGPGAAGLGSGPTPRVGGTKELEFDGDSGAVPELARELPGARARPSTPRSDGAGGARRRRSGVAVVVIAALAVAGAAWFFEGEIRERVGRLARGTGSDAPVGAPHGPVGSGLTSECRIESTPPGARVWVDGRELADRTPLRVELIPEVEHVVEVGHEGMATAHRRVVGQVSQRPRVLDFRLEPAGTLDVSSVPPGARVTVDGRSIEGTTPLVLDDVPAGREVRIRAEVPGMEPAVRRVRVAPGRSVAVEFQLGRPASTE